MPVNTWTAVGLGGLFAFLALGEYVAGSGPLGTVAAIGAIGALGVSIIGAWTAIENEVLFADDRSGR